MTPSRPSMSNQNNLSTAYALSLLSEYTLTLDSLPLDLSRNFADLRELDAVLSSSMASITTKIHSLTRMIEERSASKEQRLRLLNDIADEAGRLKLGGEDKIRVACQAADTLKGHTNHLRSLLEHIPGFNASVLDRHTTYPHVAPRSYVPVAALESGRRRRGGFGSLLMSAPDASPGKRRRAPRDDDPDPPRSPRKDKLVGDTTTATTTTTITPASRPRNNGRTKKLDRPASPSDSVLSVTSHLPQPTVQTSAGPSRLGPATSNRNGNASNPNKRSRPSTSTNNHNGGGGGNSSSHPILDVPNGRSNPSGHNSTNNTTNANTQPRREHFDAPPTSSSSHPSLPLPYGHPGSVHAYDVTRSVSRGPEWSGGPHGQLEGPGMPVARGQSHPAMSLTASSALGTSNTIPIIPVPVSGGGTSVGPGEGTPAAEGGDGDGDGDDRTYCFCDGVSYGEMIACDDESCEREWFHLACTGLTVPPEGRWYCNACLAKRNPKRNGRGGRRRVANSRAGGRNTNS